MFTHVLNDLLITTYPTGVGPHYYSIRFPDGALIYGHSRCCNFLNHYSTSSNGSFTDSSTESNYSQTLKSIPNIRIFTDLHITANLSLAHKDLNLVSGVYAIICTTTGAMYIGSSMNISSRLIDHLVTQDTNVHLQNAIGLYGLDKFVFVLVEGFENNQNSSLEENKINLLAREQVYLDRLFDLPASLRYNFLQVAGSSLGYTHTEESKAKMSAAKAGPNHPLYGKTGALCHMFGKPLAAETKEKISKALTGRVLSEETRGRMSESQKKVDRTGTNHPGFGKVPSTAHTIYVYSLDRTLIKQFPSKIAAAQWLGCSDFTVRRCIKHNKVFQGKYILSESPRPAGCF